MRSSPSRLVEIGLKGNWQKWQSCEYQGLPSLWFCQPPLELKQSAETRDKGEDEEKVVSDSGLLRMTRLRRSTWAVHPVVLLWYPIRTVYASWTAWLCLDLGPMLSSPGSERQSLCRPRCRPLWLASQHLSGGSEPAYWVLVAYLAANVCWEPALALPIRSLCANFARFYFTILAFPSCLFFSCLPSKRPFVSSFVHYIRRFRCRDTQPG